MCETGKTYIRVMDITYSSSVDGDGFRDVLFVSGCPHRCGGCHNPETWDYDAGTLQSADELYQKLTKSTLTDVTLSGGEPFEQSEALGVLVKKIKETTKKNVWVYSGYLFEEIALDEKKKKLLEMCDVLVDGRFEKEKADEDLLFRGSSNQRIIDVQKSLKSGKAVLYELFS